MNDAPGFTRLITYAIPMIFQIFLPCYYGNEVIVASKRLSTSLFHSNWTVRDEKFTKAMKIVMENIKNPIHFSAFGLVAVNLGTFTRICNFAYSLYAVFQRVNHRN